jgi:hypothetical protein
LTSLAEDTELVTFGVCQYNPRLITLANINMLCAMSHQTSHLGVLVIRPEVEMQSALNLLALIKPDEVQPRQAIRLRADLELLIRGMDHNPTKSRSPPLPQGHRIYRVNNYLLPFQGHPPSLDLARLADEAAVIGAALEAKAGGAGHRTGRSRGLLGRPPSTVRGWLRAFAARAELVAGVHRAGRRAGA